MEKPRLKKYKVVLEDGTEEHIEARNFEELYEVLEEELMAAMVLTIWVQCPIRKYE